ncbi:Rib/alpha-like domain-containing protein, partial [Streptococcus constellatus]|uniref:Rib/alpha-like domain-containing protein n=1 Tax=Streptococcus constellatus TaxID=76860 RepID=UPI00200137E1
MDWKKHEKYSIRKLSIGAVSILVGQFFVNHVQEVKAAEATAALVDGQATEAATSSTVANAGTNVENTGGTSPSAVNSSEKEDSTTPPTVENPAPTKQVSPESETKSDSQSESEASTSETTSPIRKEDTSASVSSSAREKNGDNGSSRGNENLQGKGRKRRNGQLEAAPSSSDSENRSERTVTLSYRVIYQDQQTGVEVYETTKTVTFTASEAIGKVQVTEKSSELRNISKMKDYAFADGDTFNETLIEGQFNEVRVPVKRKVVKRTKREQNLDYGVFRKFRLVPITINLGEAVNPWDAIEGERWIEYANFKHAKLAMVNLIDSPDTWKPGTQALRARLVYDRDNINAPLEHRGKSMFEDVTITLNVRPGNVGYTAKGRDLTTKVGVVPQASTGISNASSLPTGTTYEWLTQPDVSKIGKGVYGIRVTYADKTFTDVYITLTVKGEAENFSPEGRDLTTTVGTLPDPANGISNLNSLPADAEINWLRKPDVSNPGVVYGVIRVTYSDTSYDDLRVKVNVVDNRKDSDKYKPVGKPVDTTLGKVPDAKSGIANPQDMPAGTTYTWAKTPDVATPGQKDGTIRVTYPDKSFDDVPVKVNVVDNRKDNE